ncbi:MAG TPA: hypothetical protein VFL13_06045, partial [Candidatus Baltobacteraceae bacterium]|nr:hypothetical protein [Candidatus Baltobacteraceae bacterium]
GDGVWPGWSKTPFYIDLLTDHGSALIGFTEPSPPPEFPTSLEATFPLYPDKQTIVIGEPQYTQAKTPIRWSVTLLHEHFHEWQDNWPPYYSDTLALGLAPKGDNGMWMLNYPFPYADAALAKQYHELASALHDAVAAIGTPAFSVDVGRYKTLRAAFRGRLKPNDYKYFAFQCWQEGTARYTEIAVTRAAAAEHSRDKSFLTDAQARALAADGDGTLSRIMDELANASLSDRKRVGFYAFGAGEALLLDALKPGWHARYLDPGMDLSAFF